MANFNSESYYSLIGFLTAEYLGFLKLQVVSRFTGTGTCISPVPVNRNRSILASLMLEIIAISRVLVSVTFTFCVHTITLKTAFLYAFQ